MSSTTIVSTPQDQADLLMQQLADEANIEISQEFGPKNLDGKVADLTPSEKLREEDANLAEWPRALMSAVNHIHVVADYNYKLVRSFACLSGFIYSSPC